MTPLVTSPLLPAPPATAAQAKPRFPASGAYLGAAVQSHRDTTAPVCREPDAAAAVRALERCIGTSVFLLRQFNSWDRGPDGAVWPTPYFA